MIPIPIPLIYKASEVRYIFLAISACNACTKDDRFRIKSRK